MIRPVRNLTLLLALCFSTVVLSQSYYTGFDSPEEQSGWTVYRKGVISMFENWDFTTGTPHTAPNCLSHYYPVGGSQVMDDWMVSPPFDFSQGGTIDSVWHRFSGFGTPFADDTIAVYLLEGSPDPDLATKTMILDYTANYVADATWTSNLNINVPAVNGPAYLAFRYSTTVNWLDVKFDNITVTPTSTASIQQQSIENIEVYPNPVTDQLQIKHEINDLKEITVINLVGEVVMIVNPKANSIDLSSLLSGHYFVRFKSQSDMITKRIVKI